MKHFYGANKNYFVNELVEFLSNEEKAGYVQNVEKYDVTVFEGTEKERVETIVKARITKGKRVKFNVFFKGFIITGKSISYSHNLLHIDQQAIFLKELDFTKDELSIEVAY